MLLQKAGRGTNISIHNRAENHKLFLDIEPYAGTISCVEKIIWIRFAVNNKYSRIKERTVTCRKLML